MKNSFYFLKKLNRTTIYSGNLTSGHVSKKKHNLKRSMLLWVEKLGRKQGGGLSIVNREVKQSQPAW